MVKVSKLASKLHTTAALHAQLSTLGSLSDVARSV